MRARQKVMGYLFVLMGMLILLLGPMGLAGRALAGGDNTPKCPNGSPNPHNCCCGPDGPFMCSMN